MKAAAFLLGLFLSCAAWAQPPASPPAKSALEKKAPKAPYVVRGNQAMQRENRQLDGVSRTMKKRHDKAANAIRNER